MMSSVNDDFFGRSSSQEAGDTCSCGIGSRLTEGEDVTSREMRQRDADRQSVLRGA